jgi:Mn-dependent DtxR family transcriptional regulator
VEETTEFLSVDELAERLGRSPDAVLALVRRLGPRGVVRTADRRWLIPASVVEEIRAASSLGQ